MSSEREREQRQEARADARAFALSWDEQDTVRAIFDEIVRRGYDLAPEQKALQLRLWRAYAGRNR